MRTPSTAEKIAGEATSCETWEELRGLVYDLSIKDVGSKLCIDDPLLTVQRWDYDDGSWLVLRDLEASGSKLERKPGWRLAAFSKQADLQIDVRYYASLEEDA